jgi:hypothetical protein
MLPKFFEAILGASGAEVMQRLVKASADLEGFLSPRVVVGWLRHVDYGDVEIPPGCPLATLKKTGHGFNGSTTIQGLDYIFEHSTEEHVAAVVALAVDAKPVVAATRDVDLAKLAKTVDLLIKAAIKTPPDQHERTRVASNIEAEQPVEPVAVQPVAVQPAQNQRKTAKPGLKIPKVGQKIPKPKPLMVTKSEMSRKCDICGCGMFKNDTFVGCPCFSPLAKSCKSEVATDGVVLKFGPDWDTDAYLTLIGALKNG